MHNLHKFICLKLSQLSIAMPPRLVRANSAFEKKVG